MGVVVPTDSPVTAPRRRHWWRRGLAGVLVFLFSITTVAAAIGVWARQTALDTPSFVRTVRPLPRDDDVARALAAYLTDLMLTEIDLDRRAERALPEERAFLVGPLDGIVREYTEDTVRNVLRSDRFDEIWARAVRAAHREVLAVLRDEEEKLVVNADGEVTLDLLPVIEEVVQDVVSEAPGFLGNVRIPDLDDDATRREIRRTLSRTLDIELPRDFGQIVVFDEDRLSEAQDALHLIDRFVVALVAVAVVSGAGALLASVDRRRTLLQLGLGVAITTYLVFTVLRKVIDDLVDLVPEGQNRDAAHAAATIVSRGLRDQARWVLVIGSAVAIGAYLAGPGRGAVWIRERVRSAAGRARREAVALPGSPAGGWARANLDTLRVAGVVVAVVVLLLVDVSWVALFIALVLVVAYEVALAWVAREPAEGATG